MYQWQLKHKDKVPSQMALGKAINYAINQFEKFRRYFDGRLVSIDNNWTERAMKEFVIGGKNWLFSDISNYAHGSAMLYSLVETTKANNLMMYDYISIC